MVLTVCLMSYYDGTSANRVCQHAKGLKNPSLSMIPYPGTGHDEGDTGRTMCEGEFEIGVGRLDLAWPFEVLRFGRF